MTTRTASRRDGLPTHLVYLAACVHVLTASGAVCGLLALLAATNGAWRAAFAWMLAGVVVDGIDGPLARRIRVSEVLPRIDGATIDNVVDYFNYVIVPTWVMLEASTLPASWGFAAACAIAVASAIGFARADAKTPEGFFGGFPSYWNIAAFYLVSIRPPQWLAAVVVLVLAALVLAPVHFIHPTRMRDGRPVTLSLGAVWVAMLLVLLVTLPEPSPTLLYGSLAFPLYYTVVSFALSRRYRTAA